MTPTLKPGSDPAAPPSTGAPTRASTLPSTLMGPGWRPRTASHAEDIAGGEIWGTYGVGSPVAPLTAVLLTWPGDNLAFHGDPSDWLMDARPDLPRMREEAEGLADAYRSRGVEVRWIRAEGHAPPNLVFACDLMFMTPQGAVLARMAAQQRAGEERHAAAALAAAGIPILATPVGHATFEGADAMWLADDLVVVGLGRRTNEAGFRAVGRVLADQGVQCVGVDLPPTVQHLLGAVNLVDRDLAVAWDATPALRATLAEAGVRTLDFVDDDEVVHGRALNFVTLAPRSVLMPAGNPRTRRRLEAAGIEVTERAVSQYLRAAGGIGCLTGILGRAG